MIDFKIPISSLFSWLKRKYRNSKWVIKLEDKLKEQDYFYAHIIQVGGPYSMLHTLHTYRDQKRTDYLSPPARFVEVSFNKEGTHMTVTPTAFVKDRGFVITQVSSDQKEWAPELPFYLPLSITEIRNEWFVKFEKVDEHMDPDHLHPRPITKTKNLWNILKNS